MPWMNPLARIRDAWRGQRARDKELRNLVSNLPYEGLDKHKQPNRHFPGNGIKTTKYSILFFLPMNLFEQFHRLANLYFVGLAILNFVPMVQAFEPEVALIPICVILALTALKDAWEDFGRYQSDKELNGLPCFVYSRKKKCYVEKRWKDVRVGDFVKVESNDTVPADLLLLFTSDPNGVCHIETANLDGETNLKQRRAVPGACVTDPEFEPESFTGVVICEKPNINLNHFKCYIEKVDKEKLGAGISNLLLRGCTVRNTGYAIGFVVYAGHETKSMLNNNGPRYKRSRLERRLNVDVIFCILLLVLMCIIGSLGHYLWLESMPGVPLYLVPHGDGHLDTPSLASFYMFFSMIILLQVLIPISLYVSIELVKIGQIFFITNDLDLYDEDTDSRVQCKALNITEDLGQIQFIFSDKTGTLTENKMVFRRCSIMGIEYPHKENAVRLSVLNKRDEDEDVLFSQTPSTKQPWSLDSEEPPEKKSERTSKSKAHSDVAFSSPLETEVIPDQKLLRQLGGTDRTDAYLDFFLALAICNTVVVSMATGKRRRSSVFLQRRQSTPLDTFSSLMKKLGSWTCLRIRSTPDTSPSAQELSGDLTGGQTRHLHVPPRGTTPAVPTDELCYEAESPDEAVLVHTAKAYGFVLLSRTPDSVTVRLPSGAQLRYEVLDTLTFDSTRKRMSVLVRHPISKQCILYTKGADYAIMELLETPHGGKLQTDIASDTQQHLDCYAKDGLRTLCITKKVLSDREYENWAVKRHQALTAMDDREQLIMDSAVTIETDLCLLGATGVEDRLQDNVPDTIMSLREAGIRVWVLTGDKTETAVNIGYACRLLEPDDLLINMSCQNKITCTSTLNCALEEVRRFADDPRNVDTTPDISLVIDGRTLTMVTSPDLRERFVDLAKRCRSVLCCRVTPLQKSHVVKFIREKLKVMTLAVGDGANDVNMIQAADIGVGVCGQEGMQAVMASDFAISRFKHLKKLLLVHGHWCYSRLANMVIYFFYKNAANVNLLFWFQFFCGFTANAMIDHWLMIFFNLIFTSVPPVMFGIMDKDVSAEMLLGLPELYRTGQGKGEYTFFTFWMSMLDAFYQSLVAFFVPYYTYRGSNIDIFSFGTPLNTISLFTILLHLSIEIKAWTFVHVIVIVGSVLLYFGVTLAYGFMYLNYSGFWTLQTQMADPMFYLVCLIATVIALLPRYLFHVLKNSIAPSPIVQARHLDTLEPSARDQWMKEWRSFRGGVQDKTPDESVPPSPSLESLNDDSIMDDEFTLNVITESRHRPGSL
ncbi:phospholipid-transporting ATPase VB [Periophthalmus magnuspinnatus]|uniref:phospholipid-transporting ATPase VB n=1 Tax=Periophthalmus magnuspinnatus TaxID=409849 RepID=UPI002436AF50|nr:phospholipid-transporting ATPase VB [Periophthalmus magnuspinnatus]